MFTILDTLDGSRKFKFSSVPLFTRLAPLSSVQAGLQSQNCYPVTALTLSDGDSEPYVYIQFRVLMLYFEINTKE